MTSQIEKVIERWLKQLPGWQRAIFSVLDTVGLYELGYKLFGLEEWRAKNS
jgi:hypothetical protein